jgi:hypothetical protein
VKVGDLVQWDDLNGVILIGLIVGFDKEDDPIVKDCKSNITIAHWRKSLEVVSESR